MSRSTAPALNPPRQARSRDTLDRVTAAAVGLLEDRPWSSLTIAELAAAAGTSVGAFYARFKDKQALLDFLDERYAGEMMALLERHMADASAHARPIDARARRLLRELVRFFRRYRGVVRTLVMEARAGRSPRFAARTERMNALLPALVDNFLEAVAPGSISRAELRQALAFTFSALREQMLFPESLPAWDKAADDTVARAMTRNFLGYLGVPPERRR